ncbi:uncharacterized protein LOC129590247 isoform X2 [Paramacrobiotus metropolitanus]|uniref:uncharacterized protein LOC129590247 isoform X2 n=1 Tax=Paramacrobiotus metropolitanus TaxID=2943436 RepID=UPI00244607BB|nr:uncharacterized protein LOC129590247 isoform X2 [Paramacrobiotus metropolitanus]
MDAPSNANSLALAKKTGALIFFVGCAIGLCIAEILVAVANQKAQQEARKASLDYIAQVRNGSSNVSSYNTTTTTPMPDKHVAVLHTGSGNQILAAQISEPNMTKIHTKVITHRHRKVKHRKKDEDDDDDDIDDFIGNPFRIITSDEHEKKGVLVHPCKGKHCKPKPPSRRLKRAAQKKHVEDEEDTEFEERVSPRHRHKHVITEKIHKALADVKNDHEHHVKGHKHKPKLPKEHESAPTKVVEETEIHHDHGKIVHKKHDEKGHHQKPKVQKFHHEKEHHKGSVHPVITAHPIKFSSSEKPSVKPTTTTTATTTTHTTTGKTKKFIALPGVRKDFQIDKMDVPPPKKRRMNAAHESRACRKIMKDLDAYERDEKYKSEELMIVSFRDGVDEVQNLLHTWVRTPVHVMEGLVFVALSACLLLYWVDDSLQSRLRRIGLNI